MLRSSHSLSHAAAAEEGQQGPEQNNPWSELNFGEVEGSLAERLTDDDLVGTLACAIHAAGDSRLRVLKLAGCLNVSGDGLEPLRGSSSLEVLDLSLAGWRGDEFVKPDSSRLSQSEAVPIVESMVGADGSRLRWVCVPKEWHENPGEELRSFQSVHEVARHRKPKRAMSAFFLYCVAARQQVKADNPNASVGDIARILATQFRALPAEEIERWNKRCAQDRERYARELEAYKSQACIVMYKIVHWVERNVRVEDSHFEHITAPY